MKRMTLFAIILFLLLPVTSSIGAKYKEEDVLLNLLSDLNGKFLEADININGTILDEFKDQTEMEKISEEIKTNLGILGNEVDINRDMENSLEDYYVKQFIYEDNFSQISIYGYDKSRNPINIILTSYFYDDTGIGETILFINIIKEEQNFDINGIIDNVYKKYGKPVNNTTCITGTSKGKLDRINLEKDIERHLKQYKGEIVEEYEDSELISLTAFTPYINKSIFSDKKKVNLNLAIRYNEYENKTYFWIATPIITTGY